MTEANTPSTATSPYDAASVKHHPSGIQYYNALADEDRTASPRQTVKSEVIKTLDAMIHERLFGNRPWLVDSETVWAVDKQLKALGLNEPVPGKPNTQRATPLGRELNIDLMQVFMGMWEPYEVPMILEDYGLLSEDETDEALERLEKEQPEAVLLPLVRQAFFQHFQAGSRVN